MNSFFKVVVVSCVLLNFVSCGNNIGKPSVKDYGQSGAPAPAPGANNNPLLCKASLKSPSLFSQKKVHLASQASGFQKASGDIQLPDEVLVTVNIACLKNSTGKNMFFGNDLKAAFKTGLKSRASIPVNIATGTKYESLEKEANSNECILGVTRRGTVSIGQVQVSNTNDSLANQQNHLSALNHDQAHRFFITENRIQQVVRVAVIDTGIDRNHRDLQNNMWPNFGYDFVNNDNNPTDDDPGGHGTHVAGIIGAQSDNGIGISGIMGRNIQLMAVKALASDGRGTVSDIYNSIRYSIDNGADIINLSVEAQGFLEQIDQGISEAINAGVLVVAAAGNQSQQISASNVYMPAYSAGRYMGAISVGSVDVNNFGVSSFSNWSSSFVEVGAPGTETSTDLRNGGILSTTRDNLYTRIAGTSQATPIISGAAALIIGYFKTQGIRYDAASLERWFSNNAVVPLSQNSQFFANGNVVDFATLTNNISTQFGSDSGTPVADNNSNGTDPFNNNTGQNGICLN